MFYEYKHLKWNSHWCKRCMICVEMCPRHALALIDDAIVELDNCNADGLCERFCPDLAIEVIHGNSKEPTK
ncbi:MAG: ferredoxin family protein [Chloroflexota bacterium]|nr:ferredoxin family protein [Chloroflexota bacterium]